MKRNLTLLAVISAVVLTQCGCLCVHAVKTAGKHHRYLRTEGFWTNSVGEVIVECSLFDRRELPKHTDNLGRRFVCASPEAWDKVIMERYNARLKQLLRHRRTNQVEYVRISTPVSLSCTNKANAFDEGFVLFPPDLETRHDAELPSDGWTKFTPPHRMYSRSFTTTVSNQAVVVMVNSPTLPYEARKYKSWWWYPTQVLIVPAFAVDVFTAPIQFGVVMYALSQAF